MRIFRDSLARTVDSVNEAYFFELPVSSTAKEEVALWIAKQQGKQGAYADMFAPTAADLNGGIRLFTGEALGPSASLRHVTGEESSRALILLQSRSKEVKAALELATAGMLAVLKRSEQQGRMMFCCGTCDPALWRHISAGGLQGAEEWLSRGLKVLKEHRDGNGRWRRFPFFYTMLALTEIDLPASLQEMRYTAKICERYLSRKKPSDQVTRRRTAVIERALAKC